MGYGLIALVLLVFFSWIVSLKLQIAELKRRLAEQPEGKAENPAARRSNVPTWNIE